jgi:hypothetical protein
VDMTSDNGVFTWRHGDVTPEVEVLGREYFDHIWHAE